MSAIQAIIIARRRKYFKSFRQARALSAGSSIRLADHGIKRSMIFDRLVSQGIIVPVGDDRYYLDEEKEHEVRKRLLPILLVIFILVLILALAAIAANKS